ncbi:hypothetical protein HUJ05_012227 [Dendroctonus ponderosae]|nr:hypothetical protein HUJ05_012227 [Dendroctonus ponderosae]
MILNRLFVKKYDVTQHLQTERHKEHIKKYEENQTKQQTILTSLASNSHFNGQKRFHFDLCSAMVKSDIPLNKLQNETTAAYGRYIDNLIIGVLNEDIVTAGFLISSKELTKTNSKTISRFVHEELNKFFLPELMHCNEGRRPDIPLPPEPILTRVNKKGQLYPEEHIVVPGITIFNNSSLVVTEVEHQCFKVTAKKKIHRSKVRRTEFPENRPALTN